MSPIWVLLKPVEKEVDLYIPIPLSQKGMIIQ
jgi:hypothetical protein